MTTGTVKWFNDDMGLGCITPDNGREDLFAYHSEIYMSGLTLLMKGRKVVFRNDANFRWYGSLT
jgi:cold shock CspA family protein